MISQTDLLSKKCLFFLKQIVFESFELFLTTHMNHKQFIVGLVSSDVLKFRSFLFCLPKLVEQICKTNCLCAVRRLFWCVGIFKVEQFVSYFNRCGFSWEFTAGFSSSINANGLMLHRTTDYRQAWRGFANIFKLLLFRVYSYWISYDAIFSLMKLENLHFKWQH